ncbi:MAG: MarR family transcriptional regulator [Terrimicrobiaceae bacterium]
MPSQLTNQRIPDSADKARVERLADIIMVLQRCFIQRLSEQLVHGQVSFPQYFLLAYIATHEGLSMKDIAGRMNHSTAAATGLVDRLENLGYVQRTTSPADRRKVLVRITRKGSSLVARIRQDIVKNLESFIGMLTPDEAESWLRIYEKIFTYCTSAPPTPTK